MSNFDDKEEDEEINIDFSKIIKFFKGKKDKKEVKEEAKEVKAEIKEKIAENKQDIKELKTEQKEVEKTEKEIDKHPVESEKKISAVKESIEENDDEEINFDFGKVKTFFKNIGKDDDKSKSSSSSSEEDISVDWQKAGLFVKKYNVLLLLLIPLFLSFYLRAQSADLPITDNWAESTVNNYYKSQISGQINQQYPNLPDANKQSLINQQVEQVMKEQEVQISQQVEQLSNQYKEQFRDENGDTYLLAIDPYFWMRKAGNIIDHGYPGDEYRDGKQWNTFMFAPNGRKITADLFHPYLEAYLYKVISFFNRDMTLMGFVFWVPVLLSILCVVPAFFIARKIGGNVAGFFAGTLVAVHAAFLSRTAGGFADTDAYNVLFPLLIGWLFLTAFDATDKKKIGIFAGISGLLVGLYSFTWGGWWYIFDFLLVTLAVYVIYLVIVNITSIQKNAVDFLKSPAMKHVYLIAVVFIISAGVFTSLFMSFGAFMGAFRGPTSIITLHEVGIETVWPNVFTTVAEQNEANFGQIISQIGGKLMFVISLFGILLTMIKKDQFGKIDVKYAIFLTMWFIGTMFGSTRGVRFILLLVPAFSIAFGIAVGVTYQYLSKWVSKELNIHKMISSVVIIALLLLFLISPIKAGHRTAINEIPSMNDGWYNSLKQIDLKAEPDAIINSWWDFGHWFKTIGNRAVTFDGTSQNKPQAHWIGNSLLTSNETVAKGILRMLDCGANDAFETLNLELDDTEKSVNILYEIMVLDKEGAERVLKGYGLDDQLIGDVIQYTHCSNPPENYYITSEDMIRKSGVWAHFGSWNFEKATVYNTLKGAEYQNDKDKSVQYLKERYDYSDNQAEDLYYEVQSITNSKQANNWISPWPGYVSNLEGCSKSEEMVTCNNGLIVNLTSYEAIVPTQQGIKHPESLVYATNDDVVEKVFTTDTIPYSIALIPNGDRYVTMMMSPELGMSMFTRLFYFKGHGLNNFDLFHYEKTVTGGEVYVWKVDWDGTNKTVVEEFLPPLQIRASHILLMVPQDASQEQDQAIYQQMEGILELSKTVSFDELARNYSQDGSAQLGGDLGYFTKGKMVPEFEDAAFKLETGEISGIIRTQFGYHIIKVTDKFREKEADDIVQEVEEPEEDLESEEVEDLAIDANISDTGENNSNESK